MRVNELIDYLKKYDPDKHVVIKIGNVGHTEHYSTIESLYFEETDKYVVLWQ